ncbi:MFS general substrate transporter [Ceratobasidium sp. AG-I]|nr:MFS general substrate transporter [Ceratobasidium sp. AG-I]
MSTDIQERSGLLSEEPDDETYLNETRNSSRVFDHDTANAIRTAFPYRTVGIIVFSNAMVITSFHVIYPFINQMVVELGIAKSQDSAGYYSGLFDSAVALTGFLTTIPGSYASDMFGRKPVMVASTIGLIVSMFFFATGRTLIGLLFVRCIGGGFGPNWTWTTSLTILGEITDPSNAGLAYSAINIGYSVGSMISPSIGGLLAHPSDHFKAFQGDFWKANPYALPCYTSVALGIITMLVLIFGLSETLPSKRDWARKHERQTSLSMRTSVYSATGVAGLEGLLNNPVSAVPLRSSGHYREATDDSEYGPASESLLPTKQKVTVWSVLTPATIPIMITSFAMAFLAAALFAIFPLWAFTAINKGGLGAPESSIGLQLSLRGLLHVLTMVIYAPIEKRLGLYRLYAWAMAMWILSTLCYPLLNLWARINNSSDGVFFQFLVIVWFTIWSFAGFVWTANSQMVNQAAPSEDALARIVGVSTICTLLGGTLGPVFATSLFQWSISLEFAGGNLVWVVMLIAASVSTLHAFRLRAPDRDWRMQGEESVILNTVQSTDDLRGSWRE